MPIVVFDPTAASTPTKVTIYVWESLGEPGEFALCGNPQHRDFQTPNWKFRGELASVPELDGLPRPTIDNGTQNGWPMTVHVDRYRNAVISPPSCGQ
jgi:hypothetical protein